MATRAARRAARFTKEQRADLLGAYLRDLMQLQALATQSQNPDERAAAANQGKLMVDELLAVGAPLDGPLEAQRQRMIGTLDAQREQLEMADKAQAEPAKPRKRPAKR